ncbi:hypothetical protein Tco_1065636 [Tanacetum coccineum]|uniref:Uncharacterized protein n=1 Tax=Tanacetum coccineum TaxID=301880 RepID=A0ABQ5HG88_9ASTR
MMELRSENAQNLKELSMLKIVAASAEESRKRLYEEIEGLKPHVKEADRLGQRCQDLESEIYFLLKEAEKVVDLSLKLKAANLEKAELVKDLLPLADYHPKAEKIFDEAAEAFYKLKFPYISLLVEKAGQSFEELADVEPSSFHETSSI